MGWAEEAIEEACRRAQAWFQALPSFEPRVNLGSVVGWRHPAILSEQDCTINFARFLNEAGVPWDAIHHEVSISRWIFDAPHPAATQTTVGERRWRVDLALLKSEDFLAASLPATRLGFKFDAVVEFAYLSDYWTVPGAQIFGGDPVKGRKKVTDDVGKIARYLETGVSKTGYVIVFEECDWQFPDDFVAEAETKHGCRVRLLRGAAAGG